MKAQSITKRALSVILCAIMLFSCWVFTAPQADAATAGNYKYRINVKTNDSVDVGDNQDLTITLNYKRDNGNGSSGSTSGNVSYTWAESDNGNNNYDSFSSVPGFATSVTITVVYAWTAAISRAWDSTITIYVWNNLTSAWVQIGSKQQKISGGAWGQSTQNFTCDVDVSAYPYINSIGDIGGGPATVNVPTAANGSTTTAAYTAGVAQDQYGVNWYQDGTITCRTENGVTWANNKLTVTNACNRADDYIITLTETCDNISASKDVTIKTFDYSVAFKNDTGTSTIKTETIDYGMPAAYTGSTPTKSDTVNPPKYAYTFTGWSETVGGAIVQSFPEMTGAKDKTYYANFSSSLIPYTVKFVDKDGVTLSEGEYNIGDNVTAPESPGGYMSEDKIYTFDSWQGTNGEPFTGTCTGGITYAPVYSSVDREYTVTFKNYDGTVLGTKDYKWNEQIIVPETIVPQKPADGQEYESWAFSGWEPAIDASTVVTGEGMEFTAQFEGTKKDYTIRFVDENAQDIVAPQTLHWGEMPTAPQDVTKEQDAQYTYTFAGWDKEVVAVNGDAVYTVQFTPTIRTYTLTFKETDGTVIAVVENQPYGSIPSQTGVVPEVIGMLADETNHYAATWQPAIDTAITGDATYVNVYELAPHEYGPWTTQKAPTCEAAGSEYRICSVCDYCHERDIDPTGHDMVLQSHNPDDGTQGLLYYYCANNCGKFATCVLDQYGNASVGDVVSEEPTQAESLPVPATEFNTYTSEEYGYDYSNRGASLRIVNDGPDDKQDLRFSSSMLIPAGVEIVDFGYIYIPEYYFTTLGKFIIGGKHVTDVSLMDGYYTDHQTDAGIVRTFNIVMNIDAENWDYQIIARPYVKYTFAGQTYTIYDHDFAYRSVNYIAQMVMQSPSEPYWVKEYVQSKIIDKTM